MIQSCSFASLLLSEKVLKWGSHKGNLDRILFCVLCFFNISKLVLLEL